MSRPSRAQSPETDQVDRDQGSRDAGSGGADSLVFVRVAPRSRRRNAPPPCPEGGPASPPGAGAGWSLAGPIGGEGAAPRGPVRPTSESRQNSSSSWARWYAITYVITPTFTRITIARIGRSSSRVTITCR